MEMLEEVKKALEHGTEVGFKVTEWWHHPEYGYFQSKVAAAAIHHFKRSGWVKAYVLVEKS